MTLGTTVSIIIYPYKNQYKLILLSSGILPFCFRCAQKIKLQSYNTKLQPKDRKIVYALTQLGSLPVLKYSTHTVYITASCRSALTCSSSSASTCSWTCKGVLTRQSCSFHPFCHDLQDGVPIRISFTQLVKMSGFCWNSNYVIFILSLQQNFQSYLDFSSTTSFFRGWSLHCFPSVQQNCLHSTVDHWKKNTNSRRRAF